MNDEKNEATRNTDNRLRTRHDTTTDERYKGHPRGSIFVAELLTVMARIKFEHLKMDKKQVSCHHKIRNPKGLVIGRKEKSFVG